MKEQIYPLQYFLRRRYADLCSGKCEAIVLMREESKSNGSGYSSLGVGRSEGERKGTSYAGGGLGLEGGRG